MKTYVQQFCTDSWYCLEDLTEVMEDRDESGKSVLAVRHHNDDEYVCASMSIWVFIFLGGARI